MSLLAGGLLTVLAAWAEPLGASTVTNVAVRARLTPAQLFAVAERAIAAGDAQVGEQALRALAANPDIQVRSEARYRLAILRTNAGRDRDAALFLRQLLDEQPNAAAARLQLATTLQKLGDEDAALRQLRALRSSDLPPNIARFVDRLSASLQASKPLGVQIEFALAPDSNINRGTRSGTLGTVFGDFTIGEDAKAKSGVGAAVRALTVGRIPLSDSLDLRARVNGEANLYRRKSFNDMDLEFAIGPELRVSRMRLSTELGVGQQWYGMRPYQRSLRLAGSVGAPINPVSQVRLDVAGLEFRRPHQSRQLPRDRTQIFQRHDGMAG